MENCLACKSAITHHRSYLHESIFCNRTCAALFGRATVAYFGPYQYGQQTLGFIRDQHDRLTDAEKRIKTESEVSNHGRHPSNWT